MITCIQFGGDTEVRSEPVPRDPETLDPFGPQNHPITEVKRMDTSDTKFTPGPWKSEWAYGPGNEPLYLTVRQVEGNYRGDAAQVHQAEHIGGITREEMIANANLIAAAPELFEALKRGLNALSFAVEHAGGDPETHDCCVQMRQALAKARGES